MEIAMKIHLIAASLMLVVSGAAFAAEEFYVVQNPKTKSCKISNKKDDGQNVLIGTAGYPTAEEAKAAKSEPLNAKRPSRNSYARF